MARKLYVGNLPYELSSEELNGLFAEVGAVESAEVVYDRNTGRSRGFGFVVMAAEEDVQTAITQLNGKNVGGRDLVVNEARPRGEGGGGGGGGRNFGSRPSYGSRY